MPNRRIVTFVAAADLVGWMMPSMFLSAIVSAAFPDGRPQLLAELPRQVDHDEVEVGPDAQIGVEVAVVVERR